MSGSDLQLLINGALRPATGGGTYENISPTTGAAIGTAPDATAADAEEALVAARRAFDETEWSTNLSLRVRVLRQLDEALREHEEELNELTIAEVGAPRASCSTVQVHEPLDIVNWFADQAESYEWRNELGARDTMGGRCNRWIEREPIGVVAAITPWNVPTHINLAKLAPALAAGCTVVLKPAPDTPWSGLLLGRLLAENTDLPAGVVNVVTAADKAFGELLTTDPRVDMVSFTGSTATGRRVMAAASANLTKVFLELGGKSVHLILDDVADMNAATAFAAFGTAVVCGQGCALTTRVLIPRARYDEGVEQIAAMMAMLPVGDPADPSTFMGPLINAAQRDRVEAYVKGAVEQGATIVCGGKRPADQPDGFFYEATLLAGVTHEMTVAREEIFGPVLVAIPHDGDEHAIAMANDSIYGLSGAIFSDDPEHAKAVARRIRTGTMSINGGVWYGPDVPFGGYKQSGLGREMGLAGFEEHLEIKAFAEPAP
jgi:aldehyde dehydrogenase (NAD+)